MSKSYLHTIIFDQQIGFYHVCGVDESVLRGTDFAGFAPVLRGAWKRIVDAIDNARKYGIGVLIGAVTGSYCAIASYRDNQIYMRRRANRMQTHIAARLDLYAFLKGAT